MFDLLQVPLFALADRKLAWLDNRQQVLSQNIANSDTPGWRSRDMKPFATLLAHPPLTLVRTAAADLPGKPAGSGPSGVAGSTAGQTEVAPDGNGVVLDKELMKVADTDMAQELTTELTKAWFGMFRTAIDR